MAEAETLLTVLLFLGIAAFAVWFLSQAIHSVVKIIGNSCGGLLLLFLVVQFGPSFGIDIAVNAGTVLLTLVTGVFGVVILILGSLIF